MEQDPKDNAYEKKFENILIENKKKEVSLVRYLNAYSFLHGMIGIYLAKLYLDSPN